MGLKESPVKPVQLDGLRRGLCVTMQCKKFEAMASPYLDRRLSEDEALEFNAHRWECGDCQTYLVEVEELSLVLKRSAVPEVPVELRSYIITEVERRAAKQLSASQRFVDWLLKFNPRALAYGTGMVASALMFLVLLSGLKPIPAAEDGGFERATIVPAVTGSAPEYHAYNGLPPVAPSADVGQYYQLPRVLDNSALVSFSHIAYRKAGDQGMAALVEVGADGSARLVDMLDAPSDPYIVEQLWWSLLNRTFQPAVVDGHAAPTRIVLLVEKMDVGG